MLIHNIAAYRPGLTIWHPFGSQFPSAMAAEITCKLRPLCILIGYWIYHQIGYTESYLFAFAFLLHHTYYGTFSFSNGLPSHLFTSHRDHTQGPIEGLLGGLLEELRGGGFSRIACLFYYGYYGIGSMGKRYML